MKFGRFLTGLGALIVVGAAGAFVYAWKREIAPIKPPERGSFDQALVELGRNSLRSAIAPLVTPTREGNPLRAG
ncbi:hypothetical protein [Phyllobacterium zundukense]|uniref:Uncharacterized protein n=1 Tax=Phyllobacterium zundukense TaxID=1867719 RepID=A0ACD4D8V7_9HYPH|nr:hypothetical protein [Phyllobacterium zundukense]UXN62376.1 hypothetical protein N8E88_20570 [Phyllobacterium zundukense]